MLTVPCHAHDRAEVSALELSSTRVLARIITANAAAGLGDVVGIAADPGVTPDDIGEIKRANVAPCSARAS